MDKLLFLMATYKVAVFLNIFIFLKFFIFLNIVIIGIQALKRFHSTGMILSSRFWVYIWISGPWTNVWALCVSWCMLFSCVSPSLLNLMSSSLSICPLVIDNTLLDHLPSFGRFHEDLSFLVWGRSDLSFMKTFFLIK